MKVLSIISQKGGATKTSLVVHLAVAAMLDNKAAMVIDLDPQLSATLWSDLRQAEAPFVISAQAGRLERELAKAKQAGAELVIVDTSASSDSIAAAAARNADFILIPTRPAIFDLETVSKTVEIAKFANKKTAIVLCAIPTKGIKGTSVEEVKGMIAHHGVEICPLTTTERAAYRNAVASGATAQEYEPKGKAAEEIRQLYQWISDKMKIAT